MTTVKTLPVRPSRNKGPDDNATTTKEDKTAEIRYFFKRRDDNDPDRGWLFRLRDGIVEGFTNKGFWQSDSGLLRYIVRGDTNTDEITEKEAMKIVKLRTKEQPTTEQEDKTTIDAPIRYFLKDRGEIEGSWLFRLRDGIVEGFTNKGFWLSQPMLLRYIVRGDTDTDEITEKEAMRIVKLRTKEENP